MTNPVRIQRHRTRGRHIPAEALCVDRSTRWGNPFLIRKAHHGFALTFDWSFPPADVRFLASFMDKPMTVTFPPIMWRVDHGIPVALFEAAVGFFEDADPDYFDQWIAPLRGKDLACWCGLDHPCHGDVLLKLANR